MPGIQDDAGWGEMGGEGGEEDAARKNAPHVNIGRSRVPS